MSGGGKDGESRGRDLLCAETTDYWDFPLLARPLSVLDFPGSSLRAASSARVSASCWLPPRQCACSCSVPACHRSRRRWIAVQGGFSNRRGTRQVPEKSPSLLLSRAAPRSRGRRPARRGRKVRPTTSSPLCRPSVLGIPEKLFRIGACVPTTPGRALFGSAMGTSSGRA